MFGSVADLRITSAAFDEERRVSTKSPVSMPRAEARIWERSRVWVFEA